MGLKTEKSGIKKEHQVACLRRITIKGELEELMI